VFLAIDHVHHGLQPEVPPATVEVPSPKRARAGR
jgi:hypothetical protein